MTSPAIGNDAFLQMLLRSRLLDRSRLDAVLAGIPAPLRASPRELADQLIIAGELTHYQVEKLLTGRWQGLVLGPYHVLAPLGRGGMGTVYLARDTRAGQPRLDLPATDAPPDSPDRRYPGLVALKVLPPKRAREEEKTLARFRREMELGKHLQHPNVTRTFDTGEVGGVHYIAMEYVPGQSLRQVVVQGGPLSVPDAARVFADVAAGLSHAHARGLIHRDLKPSNIMVTLEGRAKVLDLGLAILMDEALTGDRSIVGGEGYILGTMDYIAPEQSANATDVGPWSDVYALGCSMYFALAGVPPFPGGTSLQKMKWHRTEEPPSVNVLNPAVPADITQLVTRMMAKTPADRPASAWAVRNTLLTWAADTISRAKAAAAHSDREAVAEIDMRDNDPSLWDAAPLPDVAEVTGAELRRKKRARPRPDNDEADPETAARRRQVIGLLLTAAGLAAGLVLLVLIVGVLRRL